MGTLHQFQLADIRSLHLDPHNNDLLTRMFTGEGLDCETCSGERTVISTIRFGESLNGTVVNSG